MLYLLLVVLVLDIVLCVLSTQYDRLPVVRTLRYYWTNLRTGVRYTRNVTYFPGNFGLRLMQHRGDHTFGL
jgi:hypothetical protein